MGYEPELDKCVWEDETDITNPFGHSPTKMRFLVRVMQYDDYKPKLEIKRLKYGAGKDGEYAKLGRLARHELEKLLPLIDEAMQHM